ncbi:hypothetical protein CMO88_00265 [Candidatus Woesearchaeota archaeon]|nr:hypothetical protein [Candidatus Woesearchaeota archaeon]|tara:strand:- start:4998 stop:5558 length:561 start_codon:yes stop_codon:yes gene_type:complete
MKKEIRLLGIDDAPFDKFKDKKTLILGVFFRGGDSIDGVLSEVVEIDGTDSSDKIIRMVKKSKFYSQLRAIMLKGIAMGGFNLIDIEKVSKKTKIPVIVVMRRLPDQKRIARILTKLGKKRRVNLMEKAGKINKAGILYIQYSGTTLAKAKEIVKISCTRSNIPEPIRVAHLMASGVKLGQSRGKV